jgi:hypothetical protein
VFENHRTTAAKVKAEVSIHLEDPVSTKTVRQELHKSKMHGTATKDKTLITENKATGDKDVVMIIKPGSLIIINTSYGQMSRPSYSSKRQAGFMFGVWQRKPIVLQCLIPTVKHGSGSVMIWAAVSWYLPGSIIDPDGQITARDYVDIVSNQVHPTVQMFPKSDAIFQDDHSPIHKARNVQSWFQE